jgi:hypothetical protein
LAERYSTSLRLSFPEAQNFAPFHFYFSIFSSQFSLHLPPAALTASPITPTPKTLSAQKYSFLTSSSSNGKKQLLNVNRGSPSRRANGMPAMRPRST